MVTQESGSIVKGTAKLSNVVASQSQAGDETKKTRKVVGSKDGNIDYEKDS